MRIELEKPHWSERLVSLPLLFLLLNRDDKTRTIEYTAREDGDPTKNSIYVKSEVAIKPLASCFQGKLFPISVRVVK
jgi:hypothetical protein